MGCEGEKGRRGERKREMEWVREGNLTHLSFANLRVLLTVTACIDNECYSVQLTTDYNLQ